jgi:hypothetical protein
MIPVRENLEVSYYADRITNSGFLIKPENTNSEVDVDKLINSSQFTDCEYRCECGAFIGRDLMGQICPRCKTEIVLHSLDFRFTGWVDLKEHKIIQFEYFNMLKRVIGPHMLRFILGDYKSDQPIKYNENDVDFDKKKNAKKTGRPSQDSLALIINRIPKSKHCYMGIGFDKFYENFEEIITSCAKKGNAEEVEILLRDKEKVFTSKIPIYSTTYRPVAKTSETYFYPKINKLFSQLVSTWIRIENMVLDIEVTAALNAIQNYYIEGCEHLIKSEMSKKEGFIRAQIVGGTFSFSARGVIILDISLRGDAIDIPFNMAFTAYQYRMTHMLAVRYHMTLEQAYLYIQTYNRDPIVIGLLNEIIAEEQYVAILREPTNNMASIMLARIREYKLDDDTISLPPEPLKGLNADFDGDALNLFFIPKELVPIFASFHHSYMTDRVNEKFEIPVKEWIDIGLGLMTN